MTAQQKNILKTVAVAMILMLLFPPYRGADSRFSVAKGLGFIFSPPTYAAIDIAMLMIELFVAMAVGGIAYALKSDQKRNA